MAVHERYQATGAQPTPEEIEAFGQLGIWMDPAEIEAWCDRQGLPLRRDWPLALLLLLPSSVSLGASASGLAMLLPVTALAGASACVLALLQTALSWGLVGRYARGRARQALAILAAISVLTGFPAYYAAIAGDAEADRGIDRARGLHAEVVSRTAAAAAATAAELEGAAVAAWTTAREEAAGTAGSGRAGSGPKARALAAAAGQAEALATTARARADRLAEAAQVDDEAGPVELFRASARVWGAADPATRGPQPRRGDYVDEAAESAFYLPFVRLWQASPLAFVALVLAIGLDALTIYLGMGVVRSRSSASAVRVGARQVARLTADAAWAQSEINEAGRVRG